PEPIVERSARAWASAQGQSYEDVISAWAGGEAVASAASADEPAPEAEAPPEEAAAAETPAPAEEAAPAPAQPAPAQPAPAQPAAAAAATTAPAPERVSPEEALEHPVVVTVPTAGITEKTGFSIPSWLGALLLIVPAFGLIYLAMGTSTECGLNTGLRVDRATGLVENCDGTPFEGRGAAGGGVDFIASGQEIYATCAGCHGPQGQGQGSFPALGGVINTFGSCADHIEWVELGSAGFTAAGRNTYGDSGKPIAGGMPGFASSLSAEQIAAVSAYERVRIGGGNAEEVLVDCGLVEGEGGEEGEDGAEGGEGTDGEDTPTDTTAAPEASR
ncbi:MAG TPA: cytochrome c, partial [Acidimicrobiia bacterium]|nr:cytochrome c [Acidimicrobiia bacterium]